MGAPAARAAELSRHWARDGHDVTVLTGFPNHPTGIVPAEYRAEFRHLVSREMIDGVSVIRTWLFPFANCKAYERMLNYSSFCASSASTGMFLSRHDVIIATSPQLLVGLSGWWLARCKRVPLICEVRDLWPESVLATAGRLQHTALEVVFLLIGEGAEKSRMMSVARERQLDNVRFIDQQPREHIPAYICASDACLVTLKKSEVFKTVIPTKMLEFMSCARPVILGVDGQARKILEDARAGIFVEPENSEQIANAVIQLSSSAELRARLGHNGRRHLILHYSRAETARAYISILEDLLGNTRPQVAAA